jgi:hypothetical protein
VGIPLAMIDASGLIRQVSAVFPADLEIRGDQQGLTINQPLPYAIVVPTQWTESVDDQLQEEMEVKQLPMNLVTFISEEQSTAGARVVEDYNSFAVITPTTMYVREDEQTNQVRAYPVPEFDEPFAVDRPLVDSWVRRVADNPFFSQRLYAPIIALFVILFSYPFILIWKTATLAVYSLLVWIITSITMRDKQLQFGKIFQIGMHSMTLITLLAIVVNLLSLFTLGGIFYVIAFMIWTLFIIAQLKPAVVAGANHESGIVLPTPTRVTRNGRVARKVSKASKPKTRSSRR